MIPASVCQHRDKTRKPQSALNTGGFAFEWHVYLKHQTTVHEEKNKQVNVAFFFLHVSLPEVYLHCQFVNDNIWGALWWWWGIIGISSPSACWTSCTRQSWASATAAFPPPCQPGAACLFTHRAKLCQWQRSRHEWGGRVGDRTPPPPHRRRCRIPTGVSLSHRYNIAPQQKTKKANDP